MDLRLILASASPQRKVLLEGLSLAFTVCPSSAEEGDHPKQEPHERAAYLARLKAEDIASKHHGSVVIGCDTLVVAADGSLLEKPKDAKDAERMLRLQSGSVSVVHSALCVIDATGKRHEDISSSRVMFKSLTESEITWWISSEFWRDRSGGFQIDGQGQLMIEKIEGDWTGVVGMPVYLLGTLLQRAGIDIYK